MMRLSNAVERFLKNSTAFKISNGFVSSSHELKEYDYDYLIGIVDTMIGGFDTDNFFPPAPLDININGLDCLCDGRVLKGWFEITMKKNTSNADWCEDTWYARGDISKGIVLAHCEDDNYSVIAFERHDDKDDVFIDLCNGNIVKCLNYIKGKDS